MADLAIYLPGWAFLALVFVGAVLLGKDEDEALFLPENTAHPTGAEAPRGATRHSRWLCGSRSYTPRERFEERVSRDASGCWHWQGALWGRGCGHFKVNGKETQAHRWAYEHHPFAGENLLIAGQRRCRICTRESGRIRQKRYRARRRGL